MARPFGQGSLPYTLPRDGPQVQALLPSQDRRDDRHVKGTALPKGETGQQTMRGRKMFLATLHTLRDEALRFAAEQLVSVETGPDRFHGPAARALAPAERARSIPIAIAGGGRLDKHAGERTDSNRSHRRWMLMRLPPVPLYENATLN